MALRAIFLKLIHKTTIRIAVHGLEFSDPIALLITESFFFVFIIVVTLLQF
jgi:hypothetical protein